MNTLIVYGTRYGNTQRIAEAIGDGLKAAGPVEVLHLDAATPAHVRQADLVVVGGPTEAHSATPELKSWISGLAFVLDGKAVAAYDTRVDMARIITGSAASGIASRLRRAGARVVASDGSFIVKGKAAEHKGDPKAREYELGAGELARAAEWGRTLARTVAPEPALAR
ncbi:MAG TPA: flavodoxin domain-containing protein [Candidatus Dormibacteraeota bacterium]|nr:flavodoxin domain-containing protein [Candidatus Dormibacteraeota bacterium]